MESTLKRAQLVKFKAGTIIELTDGKKCEFIRLKTKKFIGKIDGSLYDIPIEMFKSLIKEPNSNDPYELMLGDLFYIQANNGDAALFKFKEIRKNRIIGINPISGSTVSIDIDMYVGKVSSL